LVDGTRRRHSHWSAPRVRVARPLGVRDDLPARGVHGRPPGPHGGDQAGRCAPTSGASWSGTISRQGGCGRGRTWPARSAAHPWTCSAPTSSSNAHRARRFHLGLKAAALSQKIGSPGRRSELPRPGAGRPSPGPAEQVAEGSQGGRDAGAVPGEGAPVGPPDRIPLSASGRLKCASCGWMVTVRPARLLVHEDASGQTWQARPKRATPPRRGPGGSEP
jgi:hypothetical protein